MACPRNQMVVGSSSGNSLYKNRGMAAYILLSSKSNPTLQESHAVGCLYFFNIDMHIYRTHVHARETGETGERNLWILLLYVLRPFRFDFISLQIYFGTFKRDENITMGRFLGLHELEE